MSHTFTPQQPATPPPGTPYAPPPPGTNGLAIAGFILALLGLLGSWLPFLNLVAILCALVGGVLSVIGLVKAKTIGSGKGLAISGLIVAVVGVVAAVIVNVLVFALGSTIEDSFEESFESTVTEIPADSQVEGATEDGSSSGATREDPVPLGTTISGGDWSVVVHSVKTASADSLGQRASAGSTLLVVNMSATYTGDDAQGDSAWATVNYVSPSGDTFDGLEGSSMFLADKPFDSLKTLYKGGSVRGNEILEVPADWQGGVLAVSPGMLSDDVFVSVR